LKYRAQVDRDETVLRDCAGIASLRGTCHKEHGPAVSMGRAKLVELRKRHRTTGGAHATVAGI